MSRVDVQTLQADEARVRSRKRLRFRAAVLRETVRWHWISAAICLIGTLLFALTGITLNHAGQIQGAPRTIERTGELPDRLLRGLQAAEARKGPLPADTRAWLGQSLKVTPPASAAVEWSPGEAYVSLPGPGRDAFVQIDTGSREVLYERTDRGWIAYLNDLHKGRNTGQAWSWFIDIFAAGCVVFCLTGLILLLFHAHARRSTWPLVGMGLAIPTILALLFIH